MSCNFRCLYLKINRVLNYKMIFIYVQPDIFNSKLCDDVVIKIFSYLGYKDLLTAAAKVCTRWDMLSKKPDLYRRINVTMRSNMTTETVEKLLKRSEGFKFIRLAYLTLDQDSIIHEIAKQKNLKKLCLPG